MALAAGERLGPYEILSQIGAGGMGEGYKARDTRLERIVAIKVLSARMSILPEARERFEREARTIANLRHPNICVLYDIGKHNGADYLVLEYLEGDTLASRLALGPLPLEQVLRYAIEIADALDKAHRHGATHRDVKPGNIMLTKDGSQTTSKLLDFGLAKLKQEVAPNLRLSDMPTVGPALTGDGMILGTVQYMAPEQIEGKTDELDGRTDIFSFGATIYEMATGKKAFEGKSQASIMASILKEDPPPVSASQPEGKVFPPALDRVVKRCLAKDPSDRWQSASDLTEALKWIRDASLPAAPPAASTDTAAAMAQLASASKRRTLLWGAAALAACIVTALTVWTLRPAPAGSSQQVSRSVIPLGANEQLAATDNPMVALSPDGTYLAYVASAGVVQQLYLRRMDVGEARPIAGTEGASDPFFSPDGEWIGFFASSSLKKVSINGGAALRLCPTINSPSGAAWGPNDTIVFAPGDIVGLSQVSAAGGAAQALTKLNPGEGSHRWPQFLPDGKTILYTVDIIGQGNNDDAQIAALRMDTGEQQVLLRGGTYGRYVPAGPTGHLVFNRAGTMMAVPFDPLTLEVKGTPAPVLEGILSIGGGGQFSFSSAGSLVYVAGGVQSGAETLVWVDRKGTEQPVGAPPRGYTNPRLSPDGSRIASMTEGDLWIYDLARGAQSRLTFDGGAGGGHWTPDGKRVIFNRSVGGKPGNLFWKPADGSGPEERLATSDYLQQGGSLSPDGHWLIFHETHSETFRDIWAIPMEGDPGSAGAGRKPRVILQTKFQEGAARLSPDGHWLAYTSDESGRNEVYVRPFPGPDGKWQISTEGGGEVIWNPNGRELFYRVGNKLMAVDVETQPTFTAGKPRLLFERSDQAGGGFGSGYDVSPDGQRFLMVKTPVVEGDAVTQINLIQNWFEELKQKVPVGK